MNSNWAKILLFSLLSFAIGFLVARTCCGGGRSERGSCDKHAAHASACAHGKAGGSCCKRGGHGDGDAAAKAIVSELEAANFQGDTTIAIEGGTVQVTRTGDKMEVKVELKDGGKHMEVEEVHEHHHSETH